MQQYTTQTRHNSLGDEPIQSRLLFSLTRKKTQAKIGQKLKKNRRKLKENGKKNSREIEKPPRKRNFFKNLKHFAEKLKDFVGKPMKFEGENSSNKKNNSKSGKSIYSGCLNYGEKGSLPYTPQKASIWSGSLSIN